MPQKTFVAETSDELDKIVNAFSERKDVKVFAGQTDTIVVQEIKTKQLHKATVFYNTNGGLVNDPRKQTNKVL